MADDSFAGITVPDGEPDALRAAAGAWAAAADALDGQAGRLDAAAGAVVGADWSGDASLAYSATSQIISGHYTTAAGSMREAQGALRTFASELEDAQREARQAIRRARDAVERRDRAEREAADARDRMQAAETAHALASERALTASAAGPEGAGEALAAQDDAYAAGVARDQAAGDLRRAEQQAEHAREDLREAKRDGDRAERDARRAGRQAGAAFDAVAGAAQAPPVAPVTPVPVSLRGERPEIAALNPVFGGVFRAPGRFATPAQARAAQIAAARAAAAGTGPNKGTIGDGLSGLTHGLTFGAVDLGGDKNSDRYRGGDVASMIPVTPMGAVRSGERLAGKLVFREAVEEGGSAATRAAERKVWTRTVQFQGKRVYERDDLINPRAVGMDGKTNLDRMKKGNAPLGPDGEPIQLHHTTQMDDSPLVEMLKTVHRGPNDKVWHINQPPRDFPSGIDRDAFDAWRKRYWRDRAREFELPGAG